MSHGEAGQIDATRNWETVYKILGDDLFSHVYKEYIIFLKTRDESLV